MGFGMAVYCAAGSGRRVVELASGLGFDALVAGAVESGPRRVMIDPVDVVYESGDMNLSPRG